MMKYLLAFLFLIATLTSYTQSSYIFNDFPNAGNPGVLNQEQDDELSGWSILLDANIYNTNVWSACAQLPFSIDLFEDEVTHFRVNYNGLVNLLPDVISCNYPSPIYNDGTFPKNSSDLFIAAFHHDFSPTGFITNGKVVYKTFGQAPNRQFWIKWVGIEYWASHRSNFKANFAVAIDENTGDINFVDMTKVINTSMKVPKIGVQNFNLDFVLETYDDFRSLTNSASDNSYVCFKSATVPLSGDYTIGENQADFHTAADAFFNLETHNFQGNITFKYQPGEYNVSVFSLVDSSYMDTLRLLDTITITSTTGNFEDVTLYYDPVPSYYLKQSVLTLWPSIFEFRYISNVKFQELTFHLETNSNNLVSAVTIQVANSMEFNKCEFTKDLEYVVVDFSTDYSKFICYSRVINSLIDVCKFEHGDIAIVSYFNINPDYYNAENSINIIRNSLFLNNKIGISSAENRSPIIIKNNFFIGNNLSGFHAVTGIWDDKSRELTIENNKFSHINYMSAIKISDNPNLNLIVKNNSISHGVSYPFESTAIIIEDNEFTFGYSGGCALKFHHNSVNVYGHSSSSNANFKIDVDIFTNALISLKNNIFRNTSNNGKIYDFDCIDSTIEFVTENNNFSTNNDFGSICNTEFSTLSSWKTYTEPYLGIQEVNSFMGEPRFKSNTNLHLKSNSPCIDAGVYVQVNEDIDGDTRDTLSVDIGADEFMSSTTRWGVQDDNARIAIEMDMYPNPIQSNGVLQIRFKEDIHTTNISIFNASGISVYVRKSNGSESNLININLPSLIPGLYHIQIDTANQSYNKSFVVVE